MYLNAEDTFYSAGMSGGVAVPVPDAEVIRLMDDEGSILATAYRHTPSGRYTITDDVQRDTLLYRDWRQCLLDQAPGEYTRAEVNDAIAEGWA